MGGINRHHFPSTRIIKQPYFYLADAVSLAFVLRIFAAAHFALNGGNAMYISLFDMFKIGIGPSSSHTVGPMRAARRFLVELPEADFARIHRVDVELYGSLAHTGHGHGTDMAIMLGLEGELPDHIDPATVAQRIHAIRASREIALLGTKRVHFDPDRELIFNRVDLLPVHSNGMRYAAFDVGGQLIAERELYSIGGGFVVDTDEAFVGSPRGVEQHVPYHFETMAELLALAKTAKAGDPDAAARLRDALGDLVEAARLLGLAAAPFLPATAPRILAQLGHTYPYGADGNDGPPVLAELAWGAHAADAGTMAAAEPLFPRLDVEPAGT